MEINSLFVGLALLILLAVSSMRYGADSREGFAPKERRLAPRGIVWDVPSAAPKPLQETRQDESRLVSAPADCGLTPCPA